MSESSINTERLENGFLFTVDKKFNRVISYNPRSGNRAIFKFEEPMTESDIEKLRQTTKHISHERIY